MSELTFVPEATVSPTNCFRCHSHVGPFVDFGISHHVEDWLYLCKLCADGVTRVTGGCSAEEKAGYEARLADADEAIAHLRDEIKDAKRTAVSEFYEFTMGEPIAQTPPHAVAFGQTPEIG